MMNLATNLRIKVDKIRQLTFLVSWFAAISSIIWDSGENPIIFVGVCSFFLFISLTLPLLKLQSVIILFFLAILSTLMFSRPPHFGELFSGIKFVLVFAGLIPTMNLVKAAARYNGAVLKTQRFLGALPKTMTTTGFQLSGHAFGGVMNTGVFPILAASMPENSDYNYRNACAEASIRGMSSSATWSPFFVAFAVGQVYISPKDSWIALALGVFVSIIFLIATIFFVNKNLNISFIIKSGACLKPIIPQLTIIMASVLLSAIIFKLTALSAVIIVMPILIYLKNFKNFNALRNIFFETKESIKGNVDDVIIISAAMFVGYFVTQNDIVFLSFMINDFSVLPEWLILIIIPLSMCILSVFGVHPVITSTILLTLFTTSKINIPDSLIMQAHLIGWCSGTLGSVVSLSVITCSKLYFVSTFRLAFGQNLIFALSFSLLGGLMLNLLKLFF